MIHSLSPPGAANVDRTVPHQNRAVEVVLACVLEAACHCKVLGGRLIPSHGVRPLHDRSHPRFTFIALLEVHFLYYLIALALVVAAIA